MDTILQFDSLDAYQGYTSPERRAPSMWASSLRLRISASAFPPALHVPGPQPPSLVSDLAQRLLETVEAEKVA